MLDVGSSDNFRSLESLMTYMNSHFADKYSFEFSTPSHYLEEVQRLSVAWPSIDDEMLPQTDKKDAFCKTETQRIPDADKGEESILPSSEELNMERLKQLMTRMNA